MCFFLILENYRQSWEELRILIKTRPWDEVASGGVISLSGPDEKIEYTPMPI